MKPVLCGRLSFSQLLLAAPHLREPAYRVPDSINPRIATSVVLVPLSLHSFSANSSDYSLLGFRGYTNS